MLPAGPDYSFNVPEERRFTRPRLSIPRLSQALNESGQLPESFPFYSGFPEDIKALFRQSWGGSQRGPGGSEFNLAPFQALASSPGLQGLPQQQIGQILGLAGGLGSGQAPGLSRALQAQTAPSGSPAWPAGASPAGPGQSSGPQAPAPPQPSSPGPSSPPATISAVPQGSQTLSLDDAILFYLLGMEPGGGGTGIGGADLGDLGGATGGGAYN